MASFLIRLCSFIFIHFLTIFVPKRWHFPDDVLSIYHSPRTTSFVSCQFKYSIRELLVVSITGSYSAAQMKELYRIVFSIAAPVIRKKIHSGKIVPSYFKLSPDDFIHDCIAEVFQSDDSNSCIQIKSYFDGLAVDEYPEEELFAHLRRLVFVKVNNNIFRIFSENDPSLGKILRNMKLALISMQNFQFSERFGEICILPTMCDTLEHLPELDRDELEQHLRYSFDGNEKVPALLGKLSRFLREQEEYSRIIPVMTLAHVIRSLFSEETVAQVASPDAESNLAIEDTLTIIKEACKETKCKTSPNYVGKKNVPEKMFETYFQVIEQSLVDRIVHQDGEASSYCERLQSLIPGLTKEEYREKYKSHLEHLTRVTYDCAIKKLRKEL